MIGTLAAGRLSAGCLLEVCPLWVRPSWVNGLRAGLMPTVCLSHVCCLHTIAARLSCVAVATVQLGLHRRQQRSALSQLRLRHANSAQSLLLRAPLGGETCRPHRPPSQAPRRRRRHSSSDRGHPHATKLCARSSSSPSPVTSPGVGDTSRKWCCFAAV